MKFQFKSGEILVLLAASVMSFLANLPDSVLGNVIDKKWLLACLTTLIVVAMFRYLQTALLLTISILAIGANLPSELATALGISQLALMASLGVIVAITLLNRVTRLLPLERETLAQEIINWRQTMMEVIAQGNEAALLGMLAKNTNVNFSQDGTTPIHLAAEKGNSDIMRILISHGADFRIKNAEGRTALQIALSIGISSRRQQNLLIQEQKQYVTVAEAENHNKDIELWRSQLRVS